MTQPVRSIDPATGRAFAETPATPPGEVASVVAAARRAQPEWAARSVAERRRILDAFQARLYAARTEMAELITRENGKPLAEALLTDVAVSLDLARYYTRRGPALLRPRRVRHGNVAFFGKRGHVYQDPVGVVGVISPWNYPLLLPCSSILPALLAGNAVVWKPSEITTRTAVRAVALLHESGIPAACCALLVGAGDVGAALLEAGPDKLFFTGSVRTGRAVARRAAELLIPASLELGGSDACILLADADLERAASGATWSRFTNAGQTCVAAKRVIVERPVYDRAVELLVAGARSLRLGPGLTPGVDVGPVIRESQLVELESQLADAVGRGARVLTGGRRRPELGPTFFEPTVVVDVPKDARLWTEEVFGPVMPVVAARDADEAIAIANDSTFGLGGSIWTRNRRRGVSLARRIETGAVLVNDATSIVGAVEAPHGGQKQSGLGRVHGPEGLLATCRSQFVADDLIDWLPKAWWFAYDAEAAGPRDAFLRLSFAPRWWNRLRALPTALRMIRRTRRRARST
jgi:acyl-CoA reductase-like NAD-dependent aldehyde dehydrogenase